MSDYAIPPHCEHFDLNARACTRAPHLSAHVVDASELPTDADLAAVHRGWHEMIARWQPRRLTAGERLVLGMCAGGEA